MRFVIFRDADGQWRFRLVAANNRVLAQSEGYRERRRCEQTIRRIVAGIRDAGAAPDVVVID